MANFILLGSKIYVSYWVINRFFFSYGLLFKGNMQFAKQVLFYSYLILSALEQFRVILPLLIHPACIV